MATVPISGTSIRFMSGIPFNNDYKNTRWFDNRSQQTSYFDSRNTVHSMGGQNSFQRIEGRYYVKVNKNIDDLWGTNYLTFLNRNKRFYAFVTTMEYINDGLTHVYFEIDVLQTWLFEMDFKPSYVTREHRPLWNSDGTPVLNTIDEGLNYGTEYDNKLTSRVRINGGFKWLVIVSKTPIQTWYTGGNDNEVVATEVGTPQPLSYYIVPFRRGTTDVRISTTGTDDEIAGTPIDILSSIYEDEKAVNNIVSLYITDYTGIKMDYYPSSGGGIPHFQINHSGADVDVVTISGGSVFYVKKVEQFLPMEVEVTTDKYQAFSDVTESKLLMSPYTSLIFDDYRGNRTEYKLEHIKGKSLTVQVKGSLGVTNNVSYGIKNYNNDDITYEVERADESALISNPPSDLPIINDMLSAFLQGNRNSIQNQKNSILWNGVFGAIGSLTGGGGSAMQSGHAKSQGNAIGTKMGALGVAQSGIDVAQGAGNVVLDLQAIQAKQEDIGNIPPQIAKQGSNVAYDYGNNYQGLYILRKQIKPEYRRILGDFFKMFGYKTNRVKIPNFKTRQNWNYVQTESCMITGNFNNNDLQKLKNIFDNGITLWHTNDVGNYNLSNEVR